MAAAMDAARTVSPFRAARTETAVADFVFMFDLLHESIIFPSSESVTTCQGMNLPEACNAFFAAKLGLITSRKSHFTLRRTV